MQTSTPELLTNVCQRFALMKTRPEQGQQIFFVNVGGALKLIEVTETSAKYAPMPDNQGRDKVAIAYKSGG